MVSRGGRWVIYLNMSDGVLTGNGDGILGPHHSDFVEKCISDGLLDRLDLLNSLVVGEPVEEEIDIRGRTELLMVILAELALGGVEFLGNGEKAVDDRRASGHNIAPVQVDQR